MKFLKLLTILLFFCDLTMACNYGSELSEENLKKTYSIACKIRMKEHTEEDVSLFCDTARSLFDLSEIGNDQAVLKLFIGEKASLNHLDQLQETIIDVIHKNQRQEIAEISNLPIGIIESHPMNESQEENLYSIGIGLLISPQWILTAQHVLDAQFPTGQTIHTFFRANKENQSISEKVVIENEIQTKVVGEDRELIDTTVNGIDLALGKLESPMSMQMMVNIAHQLPTNVNLHCLYLERDDEQSSKGYYIPQPNILTYEALRNVLHPKYQKMLFLEGYMIPGASGSSVLARISDTELLIYGVFSKRMDIEDGQGGYKPIFAFTPLWEYAGQLENVIT